MPATALLITTQPTKQQLVDYANAVAIVNNYAYAITNQTLPVLDSPPDDYATFAAQFAPAKQHALNWTDNIFVGMLQLPATIKEQAADLFDLEATMIAAYLEALVADPTNAKAKQGLATALAALQKAIGNVVDSTTTIEQQLTEFSSNIYTDAEALAGLAQKATADAAGDQQQIAQINSDIANLRQEISQAQFLLKIAEVGIGLSIFVGIVGAVIAFIPGGQALGIGVVVVAVGGLAGSIAGTVIESQAITAMQNQISNDHKQIAGLNQDIILLNGVSQQFTALYDANQAAQGSLKTIKDMWTQLDATIEAAKAELADVGSETTSADYQQALTDFQAAQSNWAEVVDFADALAGIDYKWQDSSGQWHSFTQQSPAADASTVTQIPSSAPPS